MSRRLAAWGRFVHRHPWAVLAASVGLLALSLGGVLRGGGLTNAGTSGAGLESGRAADLISSEITSPAGSGAASFLLVFRSASLTVGQPAFQTALEAAVAPLRHDERVVQIVTPYSVPPAARARLVSRDGHGAVARVLLRDPPSAARIYYPDLRGAVQSSTLRIDATGAVPVDRAFRSTLQADLRRAEAVSLPVSLALLVLIFGSVVAALLPVSVGLLTVAGGVGGTLLLADVTDVSTYALNIVTLVGLGVSIDYSLFIVSRHREELAAGAAPADALAATLATVGRAVALSGLTVAAGLSALLFYQGTLLASMGAAAIVVVAVAVCYALAFVPAALAVLGTRVDRLRLPALPALERLDGTWRRLADAVMRRPVAFLLPSLALLLLLGAPFLSIRLASGGVQRLPPGQEARQGYDQLVRDFPDADPTTFTVVLEYAYGDPLNAVNVGKAYDLGRRIAAIPGVLAVSGPVDPGSGLGRAGYQRLYANGLTGLPAGTRQEVAGSTGWSIMVLSVVSAGQPYSDGARAILRAIRGLHADGVQLLVTGDTAVDVDTIGFIAGRTPWAVGFVVAVTLALMFLLTGSILLPVKAVATNLISLTASFGALVWLFQEGHLSGPLGFTPQPIDPTVPVVLFATVFGLSMDYEVLLVSRIQEEYRRTGDNRLAISTGLQASGRLITGAAAIMASVFCAFGTADIVLIKAIGIGLAVAIIVDATDVRALIVPSAMRLLGAVNWWTPRGAALRARYRLSR